MDDVIKFTPYAERILHERIAKLEAALVTLAADSEDAVWTVAGEAQRLHDREPAVQELIASARAFAGQPGVRLAPEVEEAWLRLRAALKNLEEA